MSYTIQNLIERQNRNLKIIFTYQGLKIWKLQQKWR